MGVVPVGAFSPSDRLIIAIIAAEGEVAHAPFSIPE